MKEEKYICNLCREYKDKNEINCLWWDCTKKDIDKFGKWVMVGDVTKSNNHICDKCVKEVRFFSESRDLTKLPNPTS